MQTRRRSYLTTIFFLLGVCGIYFLIQGCSKGTAGRSSSSPHKPQATSNTERNVEKQLLDTVEHAERLGKGNPLVLSSLYSLASFYRSQKEYDKAERQYQKALVLKEELSGPTHPDIATILENYADLLREAQRYSEADNLAARAAAIQAQPSSLPTTPTPTRSR